MAQFPRITPSPEIPHLEARQQNVLSGFYTPYTSGSETSYAFSSCQSGGKITSYSDYWLCCEPGTSCTFVTGCIGSTVFLNIPMTDTLPYTCNSAATCGTGLLYSSPGATYAMTQYICGVSEVRTFYLDTSTSTTSTSTSTPTTTTSPTPESTTPAPTPNPHKSTPVGAIVGGVIGGLAVLALLSLAVFILKRRRAGQDASAAGGDRYSTTKDGLLVATRSPTISTASPAPMYPHYPTPGQGGAYFAPSSPAGMDHQAQYAPAANVAPPSWYPQQHTQGEIGGGYNQAHYTPPIQGAHEVPGGGMAGGHQSERRY